MLSRTTRPGARLLRAPIRTFHLSLRRRNEAFNLESVERATDEVDVCIVGGGPAGLSAAIRLKQLEQEKGKEIRVVVLEKGGEVGECGDWLYTIRRRTISAVLSRETRT